jgi:hypothetical protein
MYARKAPSKIHQGLPENRCRTAPPVIESAKNRNPDMSINRYAVRTVRGAVRYADTGLTESFVLAMNLKVLSKLFFYSTTSIGL